MIFKVKSETDRLILADWFEEQGKDDVAHFIRSAKIEYKFKSPAGLVTIRLSNSVSYYFVVTYFDTLNSRLQGHSLEDAIENSITYRVTTKCESFKIKRNDEKYGWLIELARYYLGVANERMDCLC